MKRYFIIFILFLVTEIAIALFHFHRFVRGFVGDVLVIPLVYTFLRVITKLSFKTALLATLIIALVVEIIQAFPVLEMLSIDSEVLKTIAGTTFDWKDLVAYACGGALIFITEKMSAKPK